MLKGTFYLMLANGVFALVGYIIHFGLGRYLGPAEYGLFGVVVNMMSNVTVVLTSGFPQGSSKYIAEDSSRAGDVIRSTNRIQLVFCLALMALYLGLAGVIANLLNDPSLTTYIRLSALAIPAYALYSMYNTGYLNGLRKFSRQALASLVSSVAKVMLVFVLVFLGFGVQGAILGYILAAVIGFLISWRLLGKRAKSEGHFSWKKLTGFGIPTTIFALAFFLLISIGLLGVKALGGSDAQAGYYTAANTISRIPYFIFGGLAATMLPSISKSTSINNNDLTRNYIQQSMRYMLMLLVPVILLISATSTGLVKLAYSSQYIEAAAPLSILVFGMGLLSIFNVLANIIIGSGKPMIILWMALPLVGIDIGLTILLIPAYGITGAAWATTITGFLGMCASMVYVISRFKTLVSLKSAVRIGLASITVYFIALRLPSSPRWLPLIYAGLFLLYAGILWLVRETRKEDLATINKVLPLEKVTAALKLSR